MIAQVHFDAARLAVASFDRGVATDETIAQRLINVDDAAVFQDDAPFDLTVSYLAMVINAGEGTNEAVFNDGALAEDRRTAHDAINNSGAFLNGHA